MAIFWYTLPMKLNQHLPFIAMFLVNSPVENENLINSPGVYHVTISWAIVSQFHLNFATLVPPPPPPLSQFFSLFTDVIMV